MVISVTKSAIYTKLEGLWPNARQGGNAIDSDLTFGAWLRLRRRALDLTREDLAARVGCSVSALRKFEADELRPSKPLAELLASVLGIAPESRTAFIRFARDAANDEPSLPLPVVSLNPSPVSSSVRSNLPTPATAIVGRETELAEIADLLRRSETRLVTLTGPGGIGKTRLALEVASGLRDTFRDGVCLVSLAPISDPNLVARTIAQTLDVRETGGRSVVENLHGYLRSKQLLLLLDNFEQVAAAAPMVAFAFFMIVRSRRLEAIALLQRAIDSALAAESNLEESAQRQGMAAFALTIQSSFFPEGQFEHKVSCLERSRADIQEYGTPYEIAIHCALYASLQADPEEARSLFERGLAILRDIRATWEVAWVIDSMGHFAFGRGETLEAKLHHEEALALYQVIGELQGTSSNLKDLGRVAYTLGNYEEGQRLLEESLAIQQAVGLKNTLLDCDCQEAQGEIAYAQSQFAEAEAR